VGIIKKACKSCFRAEGESHPWRNEGAMSGFRDKEDGKAV